MARKWDQETKGQAIRLVLEDPDEYPSQWAAITTVAGRLGMAPETLRKWLYQYGVDTGGQRPASPPTKQPRSERSKRKNAELERTIEILRAAPTVFARESDPRSR